MLHGTLLIYVQDVPNGHFLPSHLSSRIASILWGNHTDVRQWQFRKVHP